MRIVTSSFGLSLALLLGPLATAQEPVAQDATALGRVVTAGFTDLRWQPRTLADLHADAATVLFFATIDCPLVQRYLPRIGALANDYTAKGVAVLVVNVGAGDDLVAACGQCAEVAPAAIFAKDFDLRLATACGVDRTAAAVVLDRDHRLVYRGRVDDQFGYAGAREAPTRADLLTALDDVLAGRAVAVATTPIAGCKITPPLAAAEGAAPTFARDIAPLLQQHCQECHRPGGEAPFALLDEAAARKHAAMIAEVAEQGRMPPWYGSPAHGAFVNHRGLPPAARATFARWFAAGAPSGDARDLPPARTWPESTWRIGEPDLVVTIKGAIKLPADGVVPYRYFVLPFKFIEDTWVEAIEIHPENRRVLHHCNLARVKFGEGFSQEGFITGYVPGGDPLVMDPGVAVRIPAGWALALQAHYVTTGELEQDHLSVGFRFPRVPVQKEMKVAIAANTRFAIPPGARAYPVQATRTLREDAIGIGLFVHMHLRGRDMKITAHRPDGADEELLLVPNYNFDWQQSYRWAPGAMTFAAGTKFTAFAHYDNSAWNPFNPDPTQTVRFGLETEDEMHYAFLFWYGQHEQLGLKIDPATGHVVAGASGGQ